MAETSLFFMASLSSVYIVSAFAKISNECHKIQGKHHVQIINVNISSELDFKEPFRLIEMTQSSKSSKTINYFQAKSVAQYLSRQSS